MKNPTEPSELEVLEPDHCARLLRAMAEPERLRIVQCLREGPKNVGEIATHLDAPIVKISHHLQVLRQAGILTAQKQGRFVQYQLEPTIYRRAAAKKGSDCLDFGCCKIEMPKN